VKADYRVCPCRLTEAELFEAHGRPVTRHEPDRLEAVAGSLTEAELFEAHGLEYAPLRAGFRLPAVGDAQATRESARVGAQDGPGAAAGAIRASIPASAEAPPVLGRPAGRSGEIPRPIGRVSPADLMRARVVRSLAGRSPAGFESAGEILERSGLELPELKHGPQAGRPRDLEGVS
jgi:hypothetical protein